MSGTRFVIAIDGPAAAGKSTVGRRVAEAIGALYFDTGCLYRALTVQALGAGVSPADGTALAALVADWRVRVLPDAASQVGYRVILNETDVTGDLRGAAVDAAVSAVSAHPAVRAGLLERQREVARTGPVVMVGRDTGTVVVPDADHKIFLVASAEERARRRYRELLRTGRPVRFEEILADVVKRDEADAGRSEAPMKAADDAIVVDSSGVTLEDVVAEILRRTAAGVPRTGSSGDDPGGGRR